VVEQTSARTGRKGEIRKGVLSCVRINGLDLAVENLLGRGLGPPWSDSRASAGTNRNLGMGANLLRRLKLKAPMRLGACRSSFVNSRATADRSGLRV
jgi:hypothetical protein